MPRPRTPLSCRSTHLRLEVAVDQPERVHLLQGQEHLGSVELHVRLRQGLHDPRAPETLRHHALVLQQEVQVATWRRQRKD